MGRVARVVGLLICSLVVVSLSREEALDNLFIGYDKLERPLWNTTSRVNVTVSLSMISLSDIDAKANTYALAVYLRQAWTDPRLDADEQLFDGVDSLTSVRIDCGRIWTSDIFAQNAVKVRRLAATTCKLYRDGSILFSQKLMWTLKTTFDLHEFPFDEQRLIVEMLSFSYGEDELCLSPENGSLWNPSPSLNSPLFLLQNYGGHQDSVVLRPRDAPYSRVIGFMVVERRYVNWIVRVVVPLALLVTFAQFLYFVDMRAAPARVAGALTTVLTCATFNLIAVQDVPKLNYSTVLDIFVLSAFAFALVCAFEYALVQYLMHRFSYALALRVEIWFRLTMAPAWALTCFAILVPGLWPVIVFPCIIASYAIVTAFFTHLRAKVWIRKETRRGKMSSAVAPSLDVWSQSQVKL